VEASALQAPAGIGRFSVSAPLLRLRSDEQLVALFRAGNEGAFGVIHDRYRQRLFTYTRQMLAGSRQDAEDALQDVFLRAYGALRADERPVSLRAWLYRVAHNRCIDQLRRVSPQPADVFDVSRTPLQDPLAETERREDLRRLVEDVRRLPEQQRSALLMRELEGLSYNELGSALGVTVPAVKSLLVRARIGLAEAVEARDTECAHVRQDLATSHGRGVRSSGLARRHMRDCVGCREYRAQLRGMRRGFAALSPGGHGPLTGILKLIGIGGAGSGAAAGSSGVAGGSAAVGAASAAGAAGTAGGTGALVAGSGAIGVTATKVAAIVCGAAITAGGAVEVHHRVVQPARHTTTKRAAAAPGRVEPPAASELRRLKALVPTTKPRTVGAGATTTLSQKQAPHHTRASAGVDEAISPHSAGAQQTDPAAVAPVTAPAPATSAPAVDPTVVGGAAAPDEAPAPTPDPAATTYTPADETTDDGSVTGATDPQAQVPAEQAPAAQGSVVTEPADDDGDDAGAPTPGSTPAKGPGGLSAPPARTH
jgi:RNA polymerase sigma factor (sigma-70 family)